MLVKKLVSLTVPQWEALQQEAQRLGIGVPELIRRVIDQWREGKT